MEGIGAHAFHGGSASLLPSVPHPQHSQSRVCLMRLVLEVDGVGKGGGLREERKKRSGCKNGLSLAFYLDARVCENLVAHSACCQAVLPATFPLEFEWAASR